MANCSAESSREKGERARERARKRNRNGYMFWKWFRCNDQSDLSVRGYKRSDRLPAVDAIPYWVVRSKREEWARKFSLHPGSKRIRRRGPCQPVHAGDRRRQSLIRPSGLFDRRTPRVRRRCTASEFSVGKSLQRQRGNRERYREEDGREENSQ